MSDDMFELRGRPDVDRSSEEISSPIPTPVPRKKLKSNMSYEPAEETITDEFSPFSVILTACELMFLRGLQRHFESSAKKHLSNTEDKATNLESKTEVLQIRKLKSEGNPSEAVPELPSEDSSLLNDEVNSKLSAETIVLLSESIQESLRLSQAAKANTVPDKSVVTEIKVKRNNKNLYIYLTIFTMGYVLGLVVQYHWLTVVLKAKIPK